MEETVICLSCSGQGHRRRTHRDCPMNPARRDPFVVETIRCSTCGEQGHRRRTHRNCPMNPINAAVTTTGTETVHCPYCNRIGHNRTNHWNCARNPSNLDDVRIARNPDLPEVARHSIGAMEAVCSTCGAFMWIGERKKTSSVSAPVFQMCCAEGEALLAPPRTLPPIIADLLTRNDAVAQEFKHNIRSYNSALSFTSMNADLDRRYANEQHGAYAFRIHGSVHHCMSPELIPNPNNPIQQPRFAQIYIFDSANELQNRLNVAGNSDVRPHTMQLLQNMMHDVNPFVDLFKSMEELSSEQPNGIEDIRMIFRSESDTDIRRYNAPTADEIGVLIVGGEDESSIQPCNRDIVLRLRGNAEGDGLQRINEFHQHYDPLHYVLMFPTGESGWDINTESYNLERMEVDEPVEGQANRNRSKVTVMHYYSSQLMIRADANSTVERNMQVSLHSFGKLFHQYIVDQYAKMEQQRLYFIRFNQQTLRAELYNGLTDVLRLDDIDMSGIGQKVILPSTFVGGPRFMAQLYQDAMNLVRRFGKPDLFITFTCNPAWPEIANELLIHQRPSDRPDLCARVFRLKLQALLDDIVKNSVLGKVEAYCYTIEFQKRGLPHCHMLFILNEDDKPTTAAEIDRIVSAEIPNPVTHPLAYETVTTSMVHGPCGDLNPEAQCMRNGHCTKKYPFVFNDETNVGDAQGDGLIYRRRVMPDRTILRNNGRIRIDNRWIVPHNIFLTSKYNAHINVEICNQFNYVKYVYKYIYKGHDRAQVHMGDNNGQQDEIKNFLDARYVSAAEACWRLFSFPMHKEYPACQRLDVHLPGDRLIYYHEDDTPAEVLSRAIPESTLTAWFKYNLNHPNDEEAQRTLYSNFCERYTFHKKTRLRHWSPRRSGFGRIIGRLYTVSPKDIEKFHLRLLLMHVPGATSFEFLRTFDGEVYPTFQAAARARGLLQDDTEWSAAMTEAALFQTASSLRKLFCVLIAFSGASNPFQLWLDHRESMTEDYLYRYQQDSRNSSSPLFEISQEMYDHCFLDLNDILANHQYDLQSMEGFSDIFPSVDTRNTDNTSHSNTFQRMHALLYAEALDAEDPDFLPFNENQAVVYRTIRDAALEENPALGPRIFFVDGPGGTGKTFVFNALLNRVRMDGEIAIAVASSGTAALLLKGGRTAHYTFRIPLDVTTTTMCKMTPRSEIATFIKRAKIIVWDECSMVSKDLIETVNRSFQDIMGNTAPFGGCLIVFGGDFRQVLPIIRGASRAMIVSQCLNRASFWPHVQSIRLTVNMRVQQALQANDNSLADELQQFADYLLQVGQGTVPTLTFPQNMPSSLIQIPASMIIPGDNLLNLIRSVFYDIASSPLDSEYFVERAILTPKNKDVKAINDLLLTSLPGRTVSYTSHNRTCDDESLIVMPAEVLSTIESGSLPPHQLDLKVGSPIMIIRNIDPAAGLCNGTRMIVNSLGTNIIEATISTGPNKGAIALIPRIKFITSASEGICPVDFERTQFPVRLSFAMTINKAQGQTLSSVGLYLPVHVFGHGQLYVALSRVRTPTSLKLMIPSSISEFESHLGKHTNNIVFREVFQ